MIEENKNSNGNTQGPWWSQGVRLFSEVSTWIVAPIVLALIFGKMLDARYGTKPVIFITLAGAAFLFSCFKIVFIVKNYTKKLKNTDPPSHKVSEGEEK